MLGSALTLAIALIASTPVLAAPPSPDPKSLVVSDEEQARARDLVRQLGSEVFAEREGAESGLVAMGRLARTALADGASLDPDPEIRARCRELLPRAVAIEMRARLDTFLADAAGRYEHDLPGWTRLRATVRGEWTAFGWTFTARPDADKAARELFVEFLKAPGGRRLLNAISAGGQDLGPLVAGLKTDLYYVKYPRTPGVASRQPGTAEVAAVLFADALAGTRGTGPRTSLFTNVLNTSGVAQAAQGSDARAVALRAVLGAWIETRTDSFEMYSALTLATTSQNDAAAGRVAARLLRTAGAPGLYRGQALAALVRLKSTDQLPAVERLIGDETVMTTIATNVGGQLVRHTITLGDAALAAAVQLTEQQPADYGFEDRFKGNATTNSYMRFRLSEDKRKSAAAQYGWWRLKRALESAPE